MHPTFCLWLIVVLVQWSAFPNRSDGWLLYAVLSLYRRRIAFVHCLETAIIARLFFFRDGAKRSSISLHFPHSLIVVLRRRSSLASFRIEMRISLVSGRRSSLVLSELQLPSSSSKPIAFIARIRPRFRIRRRSSSSSPSSLQQSSSYFELRRCRKVEEKQCALAMVSWETQWHDYKTYLL